MDAIKEAIEYFHKGGLVMWPLLLCSIMVVTIAIERYLYYKTADSGSVFTQAFCTLMGQGDVTGAAQLAARSGGECARIVSETMSMPGTAARHSAYMESQAGLVIAKLRSKLHYLGVIVTMSPLLGLLGTIIGMIGSFSIFNLQEGQPLAITGGIGEALIATASGLCVAILALCAHSYFAQRLDNSITEMEQCFSAVLEAESRGDN